ncbi:PLP-dependent aminotransferase family protein [Brevibacillus choshinensis]|uniref:PLP-dependent aminotransferase family protein n=1 Tax=Brevibacillus choshinensis TaxID=54911 RepID=A0ABX7FTF0_BRECH|nr:PLP-dependent aminotransferase family protein [Brevibacillus choshinensis]QRG68245.1 PLP-dependent aminotransferase family protein [Brevibacillus choshinensis]
MLDISPHLVEGSEALYLQLYRYFCVEIQSRRLPSGTRLPSVRALSHHLRVSKTTVETAYHQLLAEGYLESRERSGFYVVDVEWDGPVSAGRVSNNQPVPKGSKQELVPQAAAEAHSKAAFPIRYDFHQAQVDAEHFPFELWRRYTHQCMQRENQSVLYYGDRQGELSLREEIARYLRQARGVQATAEQIVIGAGTQVMITLLGLLFGLRGQAVAMEDPGYNGVRAVFLHLGFEIQPIPLEEDGIDVEALGNSGARLVYITPSHQDPTGIVMPYAKRLKLLQWANRTESYIMEDDYDGEFRYSGRPIPSLQGLDTEGRVIYLGTFSKALLPTIRISYMVLPHSLLSIYQEGLIEFDQTASRVHQETLALFMKHGDWVRHIRKMRTLYRKKHEAMLHVLQEEMGPSIRITGQDAGMSVMVEVQSAHSSKELAKIAEEAGIRVHPACHKWIRPVENALPSFQFGFGGQSIKDIEAGIRLLSRVWKPYLSSVVPSLEERAWRRERR